MVNNCYQYQYTRDQYCGTGNLPLPNDFVATLNEQTSNILQLRSPDVEYEETNPFVVFRLKAWPQYVCTIKNFVTPPDRFSNEYTIELYQNYLKARQIIIDNGLDQLHLPRFNLTESVHYKYFYIVQEKTDYNKDPDQQVRFYMTFGPTIEKALRQFALFIAKSGLGKIHPGKFPIIDTAPYIPHRRIALLNLRTMDESNGVVELIQWVGRKNMHAIVEAATQACHHENWRDIISHHMQKLGERKRLKAFYERQGILTGTELVEVDLRTLDTAKKELAHMLIQEINRTITLQANKSIKEVKRHVVLPFTTHAFSEDFEESIAILDQLVKAGYIFKVTQTNQGIVVQA